MDGTPGTCSTATACYIYGADGLRAEKTVGSTITSYTHDLAGRVIAEIQNAGWQVGYVYAGGLAAVYEGSTTYFVHADHLGSTRLMTGVNQSIYDSMDFMPFGEQILGGTGTTHKFTGYPRDSESDLDYSQFRYYSSRQGSLMSPDPYNYSADPTSPQSWNGYTYVLNNPLALVDPSGLDYYWKGACLYYEQYAWVNGQFDSTDTFLIGCNIMGTGGGPGPASTASGSGPGGGSSNTNPNSPQCPPAGNNPFHTAGMGLGGTAAAGLGTAGNAASGSLLALSSNQTAIAGSATGGPSSRSPASFYGAYAGGGLLLTFSNGEPGQLKGPFKALNIDVGIGPFNLSFGFACSGAVCQTTIGLPFASWGAGFAVSGYTTKTGVATAGCKEY